MQKENKEYVTAHTSNEHNNKETIHLVRDMLPSFVGTKRNLVE